jgi:O-antigen ligase
MPVMTLCLLGLVGVILFPERLVRKAEKMVNEDRGRLIQIDGEMTSMTGGLTRLLIFQVYGRAAAYAGLLGYGTTATNDFPPDVPYIYVPKETLKRVHSIENAYLLITLRFGFLGLAFFTGILLTGIGTALMSPLQTSSAPLMQGIASVLAVVALVLLSVWFSYICAFAVLWTVGVVSGIRSHQKFMVQNPEQEPGSVTAWSH